MPIPELYSMTLTIAILGSGNAAAKHRKAFGELPESWTVTSIVNADDISICTIPHLHYREAAHSLMAGLHVIVEKPLCGSLAECDKLAELEHTTGKRVFPIFQHRATLTVPPDGHFHFKRDSSYYKGWRGRWEEALGGVLTSHGIHVFDHMLDERGPVTRVYASILTANYPTWVEDAASISITFEDGTGKAISFSTSPHGSSAPLGDSHAGYVAQFHNIHRAITTGEEPTVTLTQARQSIELLTACYKSAYLSKPVTLPIEPDDPWYQGWTPFFAQRARTKEPSPKISGLPDRQDAQPA
jgi:predicted dehydrogenase